MKVTLRRGEAKPAALRAQTSARHGEAPLHHFFASSAGTWRVNYDVAQLVADMRREGLPFNVWMVPGTTEAHYEIEFFTPQVEGAAFLVFYGKEAA